MPQPQHVLTLCYDDVATAHTLPRQAIGTIHFNQNAGLDERLFTIQPDSRRYAPAARPLTRTHAVEEIIKHCERLVKSVAEIVTMTHGYQSQDCSDWAREFDETFTYKLGMWQPGAAFWSTW